MIRRFFCTTILIILAVGLLAPPVSYSAQVSADMVAETTTTTGTGTVNLGGAISGYRTFVAGIGTGNTCVYSIRMGTEWEIGLGTVTDATPDTLSRDTVYSSSNAGALVDFSAGTKTVQQTLSAAEITALIKEGEAGVIIDNSIAPAVSGDTTVTEAQSMRGLWSDKNITGPTDVHLDDYANWLSMQILIDVGTYPVSVCPPNGEKLRIKVLGILTWLDADDEADLSSVEGDAFALKRRWSGSLSTWYWELLPIDGNLTDGGVPD